MTNTPPPNRPSSRLGFDELIAIVVAFSAIGAILFFSLRNKERSDLSSVVPAISPTQPSPSPLATARPSPTLFPFNPPPPTPLPPTPPEPIRRTIVPAPVTVVPTAPIPVVKPEATRFKDVPDDYWAAPYIYALTQRGIINGFPDNTFRPNQPVTRAEFASLLENGFEQKAIRQALPFNDIPANFWASPAIEESVKTGFMRGYPGSIFRPNQQIPRVQVLAALVSGLGLKTATAPDQVLQAYQDRDRIPNYFTEQVAAATEKGLAINYPNPKALNPTKPATRADVAAFVYQALVQAGKADPIPSKYLIPPQ